MKEDYWKLKSRINWLNNGDTNTKFFHTSTIISHHKNRIVSLTLEDNSIIYKQANILKLTKDYFVNLFSTNHHKYLKLQVPINKVCIIDLDKEDLARDLLRRK